MKKHNRAWVLCGLLLVACGDDDGGTNNNVNLNNNEEPCHAVYCSGHGSCVVLQGQAVCYCEAGYHPEGLTCVEDVGNTPPEITSTPATDATALVEYTYAITCTDADGDDLTISLGAADTCDASLTDHGDGTALYSFTAATGGTCTLAVACSDASDLDVQTETVSIGPGACVEDVTYPGQIYIPNPPDPTSACGGVLTTGPYPLGYDAGVGALLALLPPTAGVSATVDASLVEATVTAVATVVPTFRSILLADGTGAIKTWLPEDDETQLPPFHVRVGQRVSVRVLELLNYDGMAEITQVEAGSWALVSEDAEVHVVDRTGGPDLTLADVDQMVRLTGTIISAGVECGNSNYCYDLDYGASTPTVFRAFDSTVPSGSCLTWVGPVWRFSGGIQLRYYAPDWVLMH